uniref:Uncharacterized protein n=1 Tax=Anguilla anguilla TaxID=7936 RepID=A0A0E9X1D9_ANGAN
MQLGMHINSNELHKCFLKLDPQVQKTHINMLEDLPLKNYHFSSFCCTFCVIEIRSIGGKVCLVYRRWL